MSPDDTVIEKEMKEFYDSLSEKDKRRYVAIEAKKLGYGWRSGILGKITGM